MMWRQAQDLRIFEAISAANHMNCGQIVSMRGLTPATVPQDSERSGADRLPLFVT